MGIIRTGHALLLPAPDKGLITRFAVAFIQFLTVLWLGMLNRAATRGRDSECPRAKEPRKVYLQENSYALCLQSSAEDREEEKD